MTPARPPNPIVQLVGGLVLGACCALIIKALLWFAPLMMFVGD